VAKIHQDARIVAEHPRSLGRGEPAAANVLSIRDSEPHKKSASGSYEKLPRSPQILRQR